MASLTEEERLRRITARFEMWEEMLGGAPRSGEISDEQREKALIDNLIALAAQEIVAAVSEDRVARVFCGVWYVADLATRLVAVYGDDTIIREGIRNAGHSYAQNRNKPVNEHVKDCIAAALARFRDRRIAEAQSKTPEAVLPNVLNWPRPNAAVLLRHLTFEQRNALLGLLLARTGRESLRIHLSYEPEDELLWRLWYTACLLALDERVSRLFKEGTSTIVLLGERWGEPLPEGKSAAAPMHAKYYRQLARELSRRRYGLKDPTSVSRLARLTGKSRSTIDRYLASGVRIKLTTDGRRDVQVRFTVEDIRRSIEAARGANRGPKPKNS